MDEVLDRFEEKDIKMMFAIWPHGLFSQTVWSAKWSALNPYSKVCNVVDVYRNEEGQSLVSPGNTGDCPSYMRCRRPVP
jgi:hypothetical protein